MKFIQKNHIALYLIGILLVGIAAWLMFKPADYFEMSVQVKDEATHQALRQTGELILQIGAEKRHARIQQGEAHFTGIPLALQGSRVPVTLEVLGYNLDKTSSQVLLGTETATLVAQAIALHLSGQVQDGQQQPVAGAKIDLDRYHTQTDENGWFALTIPANLLEHPQNLRVTAMGFQPYHIPAISDERPQTLILKRK